MRNRIAHRRGGFENGFRAAVQSRLRIYDIYTTIRRTGKLGYISMDQMAALIVIQNADKRRSNSCRNRLIHHGDRKLFSSLCRV